MALLTHPSSGASLGVHHFARVEPGLREEGGPWQKKVQFAPDFVSHLVLKGAEPNGELAPAQRDLLMQLHVEHLNRVNDYFDRECNRPGREWLKRPVGNSIQFVSIPHPAGDVRAIKITSVFMNTGGPSDELMQQMETAPPAERPGLQARLQAIRDDPIYGDNKPKFAALPDSEKVRLTSFLEASHHSFVKALENAGLVVRVSE